MSCKAPAHKFEAGDDYLEKGASHRTYTINVHFATTTADYHNRDTHYSQIAVYGDPELRDKIIELLNKDNEDLRKSIPDNGPIDDFSLAWPK